MFARKCWRPLSPRPVIRAVVAGGTARATGRSLRLRVSAWDQLLKPATLALSLFSARYLLAKFSPSSQLRPALVLLGAIIVLLGRRALGRRCRAPLLLAERAGDGHPEAARVLVGVALVAVLAHRSQRTL
uniref:Uncharacterized protein n=1 Tax=Florenciella parvula TaxID=236787 RepID=A0A7S2FD83_9STRA